MTASSITEIEQKSIYPYPVFSDTDELSNFLSKQSKKNPFSIVNNTTTGGLDTGIPKLELDEGTPIGGTYFTVIENKKIIEFNKNSSEKVNNDRIKLLAKKYAQSGFSKEDDARLAIVTEKIRQMIPRVTIDDFEQLALIAGEINRISETDKKLRIELGL